MQRCIQPRLDIVTRRKTKEGGERAFREHIHSHLPPTFTGDALGEASGEGGPGTMTLGWEGVVGGKELPSKAPPSGGTIERPWASVRIDEGRGVTTQRLKCVNLFPAAESVGRRRPAESPG